MVRKQKSDGRGAKSLAERIEILKTKIGPRGVKIAEGLIAANDPDVIKLAYLMLPRETGSTSIGKRNEELLRALPEDEAETLRQLLLKAKSAAK